MHFAAILRFMGRKKLKRLTCDFGTVTTRVLLQLLQAGYNVAMNADKPSHSVDIDVGL